MPSVEDWWSPIKSMADREMSLTEHLSELRNRLFVMIGTVAVLFMGGFFFVRPVLNWIIHNTPVHHVIVTGVTEAFFALVEIDFVLSLIVASPVILYEIAAFVLPGLTRLERRVLLVVAGPGLILFVLGTAAGYFWVVPLVLKVMLSFTGSTVEPLWRLGSLLSFIIDLSIPFGILAEFPLVAGVLARLGILNPDIFRRYRRYAVFVVFLISAIIAPPEASAMLLMAIPIYLMYELSALVARMFYRAPYVENNYPAVPSEDEP